jgi:hypothetical protein
MRLNEPRSEEEIRHEAEHARNSHVHPVPHTPHHNPAVRGGDDD